MESVQQVEIPNTNVQKKYEVKSNFNKWPKLKQSLRQISHKDVALSHGTSISLWTKLKQAILKRKGLIEIHPQHANYEFTRKF